MRNTGTPLSIAVMILAAVLPVHSRARGVSQQGELMESNAFIAMTQNRLKHLAGESAIACGDVEFQHDPDTANKCAQSSFRKGSAFYVSYESWGIDSQVTAALAMSPRGQLYSLQADSMVFSPPFKRGSKIEGGGHLIITPCPKPYRLNIARGNLLSCFPLPHHN